MRSYLLLAFVALACCAWGVSPISGGHLDNVKCQMDFEGTNCLDSVSGNTCTAVNGYDDDYTANALVGSNSGWTVGDGSTGGKAEMNIHDSNDCGATVDKMTIDFHLYLDAGSDTTLQNLFGVKIVGDQGMQGLWKQSTETLQFNCGEFGSYENSGDLTGLSDDTHYHVRLNLDAANMDCEWFIDTDASGDWGTGTVETGTLNDASTGKSARGLYHFETTSVTGLSSVVDNIGVCDAADGFLPAGTKCGV